MGSKKLAVWLGSPRREGNSTLLAGQVAEGARAAGADVSVFFLDEVEDPRLPRRASAAVRNAPESA